ncbi:MAG: purine-nucleoside phosphorylase [Bacteriovoracaceae bacterium]
MKQIQEAKDFIEKKLPKDFHPTVGVILGSGLGHYVNYLQNSISISYHEIPGFFATTIQGHEGKLVFGNVSGRQVVVMQGRIHAYEGHSLEQVTFPIRVMKTLGVQNLFVTNAAGCINEAYHPGHIVMIKDHINLTGKNPLVGKNHAELGLRFPDMTQAYSPELSSLIKQTAQELGMELPVGVYCGVLGPTYETPAEIRMMRILGADLVGMSTVSEVIVACHAGIKVAGISCITNMGAGMTREKLTHEEVKKEADKINEKLGNLINKTIEKISKA